MRKTAKREMKELGELRTSQLITSYGVGAMVDFRHETAILAGADDWYDPSDEKAENRILRCHNLEKILDKGFFVKPKSDQQNRAIYKQSCSHDIGAYRFPKMLYCPSCMHLASEKQLAGNQTGELKCPVPGCGKRLVPSRFVVVCRHGHIDDFPYSEWVHQGKPCEKNTAGRLPKLKLFNINGRTNLGSLMISCEDCGKVRSMQEAFVPQALASVYQCTGFQPWLNRVDPVPCTEKAVVRMRASAGVYMPVNISALNIPPWSAKISMVLLKHLDALEGKQEDALRAYIQKKICPCFPNVSIDHILDLYNVLVTNQKTAHPSTLRELYEEEYRALCEEADEPDSDFCSRRVFPPAKYKPWIDEVVAIDRLTEIVAMAGFTRVQGWDGNLDSRCLAPIFSRQQNQWLPAVDMHGEGIFIRLNEEKVQEWEKKNEQVYRPMMGRVKENHFHCENASARYVLLHTISHLLIRSLERMCGYQASALKERIYSTYTDGVEMAGILIYTASSDSEGSLGGLVAQAAPEHMEENLDALLNEAEWCSGDPLCMTSTGAHAQGLYGLNYAACHQCTLLPETSCTMRNLLLDRGALIGRMEDRTVGFFR